MLWFGQAAVGFAAEEPDTPTLPGSAETGEREETKNYPILDWLSDESVVPGGQVPAVVDEAPEPPKLGDAMDNMGRWNPVVASVNGVEIRWMEVMESGESLPAAYRSNLEAVFLALLDRMIDRRLLIEQAESEEMGSDPEIDRQVRAYRESLVLRAFADRLAVSPAVTRELGRRYEAYLSERTGDAEVRAAHILLPTRPEAREVIEELKKGADFEDVAREHSVATSAARGGDLGFFRPARMAPAFEEALSNLKEGEYTIDPVPSKLGWHVIKLKERRVDEGISQEEVLTRLKRKLLEERLAARARILRKSADIELFPEVAAGPDTPR